MKKKTRDFDKKTRQEIIELTEMSAEYSDPERKHKKKGGIDE